MERKIDIEKQILRQVVRTALFLVILILLSGRWRVLLGYLLGVTISVLMFFRIISAAKKTLKLPKEKVKIYRITQYTIRYMVYGATLYVAYSRPYFSFGGTAIGLLTIKIGITSWAMWNVLKEFYKSTFKTS